MELEPNLHCGENENAVFSVELSVCVSAWVYRSLLNGGGTDVCSRSMDMDGWKQDSSQ
jgi:hypothetical protein